MSREEHMRKIYILTAGFVCALLHAETPDISVRTISNYNTWGWNAVVMQNHFIKLAIVPAIGGRVMEYNLGGLQSIFVNPAELGKTYTPSPSAPWHNFGGFKTWPAPQSQWDAGGWPPPPVIDGGNYSFLIDSLSEPSGSVAVTVSSPPEKWFAPNVRIERKTTAHAGTSRITMDQTFINEGTGAVRWSVWGVTEGIVHHPGKSDYGNYWVYFPINPQSVYGKTGVNPRGNSNAWRGEVAPGVFGVQYTPDNRLLYADPNKGWIVYADISDKFIVAKTFTIFEGASYPDNGCRVTVYVGPPDPSYLEFEVKGPTVELAANGGKYTFTENWWAATVRAPVLDVDSVGAVAEGLAYDSTTQNLTAVYGVFYKGTAKVVFVDAHGKILFAGRAYSVSPLSEFQLREAITIPKGAATVQIRVYDSSNGLVGILETATVYRLLRK